MANILFATDSDFRGSGYINISIPLCEGLANKGHNIYILGLNYEGNEHTFPFSILPAKNFQEIVAIISNFMNVPYMPKPDILIVALDIPHQHFLLDKTKDFKLKYICITPLENPPLTMSWAAPLLSADAVYFISEVATQAARDAGIVNAEHIQIGINENWKAPTQEERERIRKSMGVEDKFVILTVADNQERKNLWAALEMIGKLKKEGIDNLKYILITRENLTFGWRLRDLATDIGINEELNIVERGLPFSILWTYYAAADLFLLTSKAEGLCAPILECMATETPVLANTTGAIPELLADGRGYLIPAEYEFIDVWGNEIRSMVNIEAGAELLKKLMSTDMSETVKKAKKYVNNRTWDVPVNQLDAKIKELVDEI